MNIINFSKCPKCSSNLFVKNSKESNSYCFNSGCGYAAIKYTKPFIHPRSPEVLEFKNASKKSTRKIDYEIGLWEGNGKCSIHI